MAEATLDTRRLMRQVTLQVHVRRTHVREYRARMWLAVRLIRLAAWVLGSGIDVRTAREGA
ncbi:MAG: hypothetical protein GX657_02455 [Chloroflexi bacterium]|nr:hypothetical protein [Chloroflexota bacterium]